MRRFFALASLTVLLAACQTLPIYTVENAEIFTASGKTASLAQIRRAIIQGAISKKWKIKELNSNTIVARLDHKKLEAVVTIEYSPQRYSIRYRDSKNLAYGGGNIHSRYNRWVKLLRARIDGNLAGL